LNRGITIEKMKSLRPYAAATLLLLVPCFWQPRLQAGDLSSHIYNAWLAQLIGHGQANRLTMAPQTTNVLFDWLLSALMPAFGAAAAQRIAVSLAVLIFAWGAFALVAVVSQRPPWHLMPALAMLSYGWVFHSGFFNFYLSLGLCFWALAAAWEGSARATAAWPLFGAALPLFALAWLAHILPVLWGLSVLAYVFLARRIASRRRAWLLAGSLAAMALLHAAARAMLLSQWYPRQILLGSGADQAHVFDDKYYIPFLGLLLIFVLMLVELLLQSGVRQVASGIPFQVWVLGVALVALVPTAMIGHGMQAAFISDRMSLPAGVCLCALLASARPRRLERYALLGVALVFFGCLYRDERILNAFEDRLEQTIAQLPGGQRVVSAIDDPDLHVNALTHMIDRVCIGRCYSYANYEASTADFRIRAEAGNPFVAANYEDSWNLQNGTYIVKPRDLPLHVVTLDESGQMVLRSLHAGQTIGSAYWKALPDLF
jgi:hypothetical protein